MGALRGEDSRFSATRPSARLVRAYDEQRLSNRTGRLGTGSLACPRCDAPVLIGPEPRSPGSPTACPFCEHGGPLREFLSLEQPTRPARVIVRVARPPAR